MELLREDLAWCLRTLPGAVFKLLQGNGPGLVMAGGYVRSRIAKETACDVDLFSTTKTSVEITAKAFAKSSKDVHETDNAFTVRGYALPVQFIHRWTFATPQEILPSFDFTIARAAIWFENETWHSLCDDRFYPDLAAKRLVYCAPIRNEDAGGSLLRVLKFYQRGYRIPLDSLGAVIARLNQAVDLEKVRGRDESQWAKVLTGLLREVDPNIDPTLDAHFPASEENSLGEVAGEAP